MVNGEDLSGFRWTVDEREDLEFVRAVCEAMGDRGFGMRGVIDLLHRRPELAQGNAHFNRNEGLVRSLQEDYRP